MEVMSWILICAIIVFSIIAALLIYVIINNNNGAGLTYVPDNSPSAPYVQGEVIPPEVMAQEVQQLFAKLRANLPAIDAKIKEIERQLAVKIAPTLLKDLSIDLVSIGERIQNLLDGINVLNNRMLEVPLDNKTADDFTTQIQGYTDQLNNLAAMQETLMNKKDDQLII